jgi:hypothetical protein
MELDCFCKKKLKSLIVYDTRLFKKKITFDVLGKRTHICSSKYEQLKHKLDLLTLVLGHPSCC